MIKKKYIIFLVLVKNLKLLIKSNNKLMLIYLFVVINLHIWLINLLFTLKKFVCDLDKSGN